MSPDSDHQARTLAMCYSRTIQDCTQKQSFPKLLAGQSSCSQNKELGWIYVHRSLVRSISPNSSLLHPLREVATEVAEAAEEVVEKEEDGLLVRTTFCLL